MKPHSSWHHLFVIYLLAILILLTSCLKTQNPELKLKTGLSQDEVRHLLGQPNEMRDFVMPDGAFFGPQEILSGVIPAGGLVEEWRYNVDDEVMYLWFYSATKEGKDKMKLISTATVPKDAIY